MTLEGELANTRLELDGARLKIARLEAEIAALREENEGLVGALRAVRNYEKLSGEARTMIDEALSRKGTS